MKKRLVATLCSAVIALSSLTGITSQAAEVATTTDTTATTNTVLTPVWDTYENLHIYGKSFSGTLPSLYTVAFSYQTNVSSNFTVTATDLYNNTADGYTLVKVTATRTPNETRYGQTSSGKITTDINGGVVSYCGSYGLTDSLGYQISYTSQNQAYEYIKSISEVGDYYYSSYTWNTAKYFLEPYGYSYEYLKALAAQIYPKNSTGYSNWSANPPSSASIPSRSYNYNKWLGNYDSCMDNAVDGLIYSALEDIYGSTSVSAYMSSLGNCVFILCPSDGYDTYYAIPSSEKFYYAFNNSRKLTRESDSYNSTHFITLN